MSRRTFSEKELNNYKRQKDKAHFNSPEEEYDDAFTKYKECKRLLQKLL